MRHQNYLEYTLSLLQKHLIPITKTIRIILIFTDYSALIIIIRSTLEQFDCEKYLQKYENIFNSFILPYLDKQMNDVEMVRYFLYCSKKLGETDHGFYVMKHKIH